MQVKSVTIFYYNGMTVFWHTKGSHRYLGVKILENVFLLTPDYIAIFYFAFSVNFSLYLPTIHPFIEFRIYKCNSQPLLFFEFSVNVSLYPPSIHPYVEFRIYNYEKDFKEKSIYKKLSDTFSLGAFRGVVYKYNSK